MDILQLDNKINVMGRQVKSFPSGIKEAFDSLASLIENSTNRSWFGISYFDENNTIIYHAAAEETETGEAEKYGLQRYTIENGVWLTEAVNGWKNKTGSIKDVFHQMMQDERADLTKPCIEWYKTDEAMLCMVKSKIQVDSSNNQL